MVVERVLGNIEGIRIEKEVIPVFFEWFELEKKRIAKTAKDGTQLGICISELLNNGDILMELEDKIEVTSMIEMGRLCFELGNRHLSLKIEETYVAVPYDHPTFEYLCKLGFQATKVVERFTSFTECKAHGSSNHTHAHSHAHGHNHEHTH